MEHAFAQIAAIGACAVLLGATSYLTAILTEATAPITNAPHFCCGLTRAIHLSSTPPPPVVNSMVNHLAKRHWSFSKPHACHTSPPLPPRHHVHSSATLTADLQSRVSRSTLVRGPEKTSSRNTNTPCQSPHIKTFTHGDVGRGDYPNPCVHPLLLTPLSARNKWPSHAHNLLRGMMLEHNFFSYSKLSAHSSGTFDRVMQELHTIIDPEGWDPARHDELLRGKVRNKIQQIRSSMLDTGVIIRRGKDYIRNPAHDQLAPPNGQQHSTEGLGDMTRQLDQIDPENLQHVLRLVMERMGKVDAVVLVIAEWITDRRLGRCD